MSVGWKTAALLAMLPALGQLALAAPRARPRAAPPKKPAKDTAPEPPAPPPDAASDKAAEPPAAPPAAGASGAGAGGAAGGANPGPDPGARPADKPDKPDKPDKAADGPDVDSLRQEYLGLRDELFKSRARANSVASQLYSTRIQIKLTYTTGRYYNPAKSSIRLDGANVYEDATGAIAGDDGVRFDGYVAPGRHLITFRVEATGKDDDTFTSTTETQVTVKAVAGKDLVVAARARDSGDISYEWKRSEHGSYGLGIDVAVKTAKAPESAPAPAASTSGAPAQKGQNKGTK
jgi:hypothetical protein